MTCASCGRSNRDESRFCVGCGTALVARCPACGREAESDARFCGGCGSSLAAPPPAAPASSPTQPAENTVARKTVTIVFADLAGSTALHERLDAESARALMDRYYRTLHAVVDAHGGTVVKLLGDGVMVAFGVPRVAEDDAIRAVRAAVGMQQAFRTLAEEQAALGATGLRVAVNTGEVVVSGAHDDVVGDPVNVAARLQQEAQDGDVLIGEATRRLVNDLVTFELFGMLTLRGRTETVAAYRVVSLEQPVGAPTLAFVGRDEELRRLATVYDSAVTARAARLAVILGSPGLGKSRLVGELVRRFGDGVTAMSAHCDAAGGASFAPLANGLRGLLGLEDAADGDVVRTAIEERIGGDAPDRARIATGVAALLAGTPAAPEETFFAIRRFLAALAAAQPVVLVIDDLQWAEPLLLDLVEHLVQWSTDVPLLILVAARPELRDVRSSLAVPGGLVSDVVTLAGLDAGAATRLAANAIGADELPAAVAGRLLATSEGNPLFVGELVRMLVQDGALKREGDRWTTAVELSTLAMPPTIHALLAARIERLRPEERMVLERAAIVGRQFSRAAIAHLLSREVTDLDARLEALRRSELIEPDTGWLLGEPALTFHHGLIRDAAYRRILKGTRAELHERFADWLASRAGTSVEHDETMGWHLEQAHQHLRELGPIDARGRAIGERAARHLAAAGRRALERDDLPLAGSLLGRAVDRLDAADPTRADLALDWCEALLTAGDVGPAAPAVAELARFMAGSERLRAWHTCFAGQLAALTDPATLRSTADAVADAATTLASLDDAAGEAKAHAVHATALARLGEIGACEAALDRALAAARRASDRRRANAVLAGAPVAALWGPSPVTRASGRCLDIVRVLRITQGAPAVEAVALRCQAVLEALRGRAEAARRMIAASRKLVEELGITQRLLEAEVSTGLIELLEGDAVAAERALHPAYDGLRRQGLGIDAAQAAALLGRALLAQGRAAEAEALSHESELLAGDDLKAAIAWRGIRAEALARRGEHGEAIALARAAVGIAAATDALLDHADARLALAAALRAAGKGGEADAEEARAIGLWEAKGAVLLAERARRDGSSVSPATSAPENRVESVRPVRRRVRTNAALDSIARLTGPFTAHDLAGYDALVAEDYVGVHHATGLTYGRDEARDRVRAVFRSKDVVLTQEPLATLGDTLVMSRMVTSSSGAAGAKFDVGPYDLENVVVVEVDAHGRRRRFEQFAEDHLGDAIARLYERYAELLPDGPAGTRAAATARSVAAHMAPFDLERLATTLGADVAVVDHRTVGFGTLHGAERLRHALQSFLDLIDGFAWRAVDVLALEAEAFLLRYVGSGTERVGGSPYERTQLELMMFGVDGLLQRWERFDVEHAAAALARFDALVGVTVSTSIGELGVAALANTATESTQRIGEFWLARDWPGMVQALPPVFRYVDRRPMARLELDRAGYVEFIRQLGDMGSVRSEGEILATRGDRLALGRMRFEVAGGDVGPSEIEFLDVVEANERGETVARIRFDPADRAAAYAELDARFAAGEAAAHPRAAAWLGMFRRLTAARDWDGLVACCAPSFVAHDHRLVGWGTLGDAAAWVEALRVLTDLAPDVRRRPTDHIRISDRGWMIFGGGWVGTRDGGPFEIVIIVVSEVDEVGRHRRVDLYELTQLDQALARFAAISSTPAVPPEARFANDATRAWAQAAVRYQARDWSLTGPGLFSERFRYTDRRRMAMLDLDLDAFGELTRQLGNMRSLELQHELLATRGERLALVHIHLEVADADVGPSEILNLNVIETDEHGRVVNWVRFDPDDVDAAYAELDARFEAGEGARYGAAMAANRVMQDAVDRRDWGAISAAFAPGFAFDDHRLLGWGTTLTDAATWVRAQQALEALAPDVQHRIEHLHLSDSGFVAHIVRYGTRDGGAFESPFLLVTEVDQAGMMVRHDVYDVGDYEQARARFDALTAKAAPMLPTPFVPKPNAATATMDRIWAAFDAGDLGAARALFTMRLQWEDRRPLVGMSGDVELMIASVRERLVTGARLEERVVIGTAGDRIAIARVLWAGGPPEGRFEVEYLALHEVDAAGLVTALIFFDVADELAARREARDRWLAVDPVAAVVVGNQVRFIDAWNDGDRVRVRATLADDLVVDDHRRTGMGRIEDVEVYVDSIVALWELAPDARLECRSWLAVEPHGTVFVLRRSGQLPDGGAFESEYLALGTVMGSLCTRIEMFELDAADAALARFEELRPDLLRIPPNAATRANDRYHAYCRARDWEALRTHYHPACVFENRRRLLRSSGGIEMAIANARHLWEPGVDAERTVLATSGDRLVLEHWRFTGREGDVLLWERESLIVEEVDAEGRVVAIIIFDVEDRATASDELVERGIRLTFPPAVADRFVETTRARRARDLPRLRATFPDEFYFDDHRRTGFGRLEGPDAYMASVAALYEQSPDVTVGEPLYRLAEESYGSLAVGHTFGTLNDGGAFESVFVQIGLFGANGLCGIELFELEDIDRARARFAELCPNLLRIPPNAATRAWDRWERLATAGDWDAVHAHYDPSYRCEDRRRLFRMTLGLDEIVHNDRHLIEDGWRAARTLLATAGDRLALQRVVWTHGDESARSEVEILSLDEVDGAGRAVWAAVFDPEDRAAASDELAERYARLTFPPAAALHVVEVIRARRSRDLARIRAALPDEFHLDDHRRTGLGRVAGAEAYTAALAALFELSPDVTVGEPLHYLAEEAYGALYVNRTFGTQNDGGAFESIFLTLVLYGDVGPVAVEAFELEDLDRARARFAELRPDPPRLPRTSATRAIARSLKAMSAADWDAVRALVRDDFVFEDRSKRALVRGDIETWLGSVQFTMALPEIRFDIAIIATLGEGIALQRMVAMGGPEGGEFEFLHRIRLFVVDAAGKLGTVILFDLDERKLAFVEALERFAAGEAAAGGVAPFAALMRAFAAYDWEAVRRTLAPDFVFDDHRALGLGRLDRDQWIASMQAEAALGPGLAAEVPRILAWNRHGLVVELRTCGGMGGTDGPRDGGGPFENVALCVFMTSGDDVRSGTLFDLTDADSALAWFAEQTSTQSPT